VGVTLVPIGLVVASFFPLRSPIPLYLLAFGLAGAAMLLLPRICTAGTRAIRLVASPKGLLAVRLLQCTLLLVRVMMGLPTIGSTTSSLPMVSPAATPPPRCFTVVTLPSGLLPSDGPQPTGLALQVPCS